MAKKLHCIRIGVCNHELKQCDQK